MPTKTKILVDTNVLLYAYDSTSAFYQPAEAFLSDPGWDFYVSTKNISEFFGVLSKQGAPFPKAFQFYQSMLRNATVLFPDPASLAVFEKLLQKYQPKGNRVFDLEIVSIAVANQVSEIATVNIKDFAGVSEITVRPL